jgi:hypothetical protein
MASHARAAQSHVYRPGQTPRRLLADGFLEGEPTLPGYRLALTELFGWLIRRKPVPPAHPTGSESSAPGEST